MKRARKTGPPWFRPDSCVRCGTCLAECPVLEFPPEAAAAERRRLNGDEPGRTLAPERCTTCNVCDFVCPRGAAPYEQMLEKFDVERKTRGLPPLARMVFPSDPDNIWSALRLLLTPDEGAALRLWEDNLKGKRREILLTGFYTNLVPFLALSPVIRSLGMEIAGSEGLWGCGGDSNKMGLAETTGAVAVMLREKFGEMGVRRVVCFMQAEAAMLGEILPGRYGVKFPFRVTSLDAVLLEKMKRGEIPVRRKLGMTVTVHDNCMSRYMGGEPQDVLRAIVGLTGCTLVEMEHSRSAALCCGWAATIPTLFGEKSGPPFRTLLYMLHSLRRRMREAERTGADALVTGCPACYLFLSLIAVLTKSRMKVLHVTELVGMAAGEEGERLTERRVWDVLAVCTGLIFKWLGSKEYRARFFPAPPSGVETGPDTGPRDARRIRRWARLYHGRLVQNPLTRALVGLLVKSAAGLYGRALSRERKKHIQILAVSAAAKDR